MQLFLILLIVSNYMVYPDKENVLKINLTISGEFEIEDHAGGFEFARLVVSP